MQKQFNAESTIVGTHPNSRLNRPTWQPHAHLIYLFPTRPALSLGLPSSSFSSPFPLPFV